MTRYTARDARAWTLILLTITIAGLASADGNFTATVLCAAIATGLLLAWARRRHLEEPR